MAYSTFNIERDEERTRIVNAAFRHMGGNQATDVGPYTNGDLKHDADIFSLQVWPKLVDAQQAEELEGDPTSMPSQYLAHPFVVEGGGTILFAPPGRGKSYTGMLWLVAVDSGTKGFWPIKKTKGLFVNLERSKASIQRRLGTVNTALGLDPGRTLLTLNARGKSLADVRDLVTRAVHEHGVEFILVDSLSRAGVGDLTENKPVNQIVDILNSLVPSWIGIAHTPRNDDSHLYGSIFFEAAADIVVRLKSQLTPTGVGVKLEVVKINDGPMPAPQYLAYDFDEYGLSGVKKEKASAFADLMADTNTSVVDQIEVYLSEVSKASATQVSQATGLNRSAVSSVMNSDKRFVNLGKQGREVMYGIKIRQESF